MCNGAMFPISFEAARNGALRHARFFRDFGLRISRLREHENFLEKDFVDGHVCGSKVQKILCSDLAGATLMKNYAFFL